MPKSRSVAKRARQSEERRLRNRAVKSRIKTLTKRLKSAKDKDEAQMLLRKTVSAYDRASQKGALHPRTAARKKSRLMKQKMASSAAKSKKGK